MSLKVCKECGETVSTRAKYCPHCGTDNPHTGRVARFTANALAMVIVIPIAVFVIYIVGNVLLALIRG